MCWGLKDWNCLFNAGVAANSNLRIFIVKVCALDQKNCLLLMYQVQKSNTQYKNYKNQALIGCNRQELSIKKRKHDHVSFVSFVDFLPNNNIWTCFTTARRESFGLSPQKTSWPSCVKTLTLCIDRNFVPKIKISHQVGVYKFAYSLKLNDSMYFCEKSSAVIKFLQKFLITRLNVQSKTFM